jgi:hypothetical protein
MKAIILYHGSPNKLIGDNLIPKEGKDVNKERTENFHKAVYATDIKNAAIVKAIISSKGVHGASLNISGGFGIIYRGWPNKKWIYLYYLPSESFERTKENIHQYISKNSVKPIKTERLEIDKYLHLIRKASKQEAEGWIKQYNLKR